MQIFFRISQTEQKLKNKNIKLESEASETRYEVCKETRNTIYKLVGTMSENLLTLAKNLKELEKVNKINLLVKRYDIINTEVKKCL